MLRHVLFVRVSPFVEKTEGTARQVPGMWMTLHFRLPLWNGVGLVIHKLPEFQLSETCGILCQAAWQGYLWHLVVKLLGGLAPQVQFTD